MYIYHNFFGTHVNLLKLASSKYEIVQIAEIIEKNGLPFQDFWRYTYTLVDFSASKKYSEQLFLQSYYGVAQW